VLNRIYIAVGLLAILVLAAAFLVPQFIQWSDYRDRMESLAAGVLGEEVTILGDIQFSLLPQPRLAFTEVVVGDLEAPLVTVASVDAEFALIEFLRDQYDLTRLVLTEPVIDLTIDENGLFAESVSVNGAAGASNVVLRQAQLVDGRVRLADYRADENFVFENLDGELRLESLAGPFQFQGSGVYDDRTLAVRFNAGAIDGAGNSGVTAFVQDRDSGTTISSDGVLTPGVAPRYDGTITFRQAPPPAQSAEEIRGDLLLESRVQINTDRIVLSGYTLTTDVNRPGTRLTGAASMRLGAQRSFDAVISGGVFSLAPRDVTEDQSVQPFELVRLIEELPAPFIPDLPGRIGVDLAEMTLRGFSLRDVRLDAEAEEGAWRIESLSATMPGETSLRIEGTLQAEGDRPRFNGQLQATSRRLDALAALWRRPQDDNPLFNLPGSYRANIIVAADAVGLSDGVLVLDETSHGLDLRVGIGAEPRLDVVGRFSTLSADDSDALLALLPDVVEGPAFGNSFPIGSLSLAAGEATFDTLSGTDLRIDGTWEPGVLSLRRVAAADFGGAVLDLEARLAGTLAAPDISGGGSVGIERLDAPFPTWLADQAGVAAGWRTLLDASLPATVDLDLSAAEASGMQTLTLEGLMGAAETDLSVTLSNGLAASMTAPFSARLFAEADDANALATQFGFASGDLFRGDRPGFASASLSGTPGSALTAQVNLSAEDEFIAYVGVLQVAGERLGGEGQVDLALDSLAAIAPLVRTRNLPLTDVEAQGLLRVDGQDAIAIDDLVGRSGDTEFSGALAMTRTGPLSQVTGDIALDSVGIEAVAGLLAGPAALIDDPDTLLPIGPMTLDPVGFQTRGTIAVSVPDVTAGGTPLLADATFDFAWDATRVRIDELTAGMGEGKIGGNISVCCASALAEKTLAGRLNLDAVPARALLPGVVDSGATGLLSGGVSFEASGASFAEMARTTAGEGSISVTDLALPQLDPEVYRTVADLDDLLNMDLEDVRTIASMALDVGSFESTGFEGAFTIAGGTLRLENISVDAPDSRLSGGLTIDLPTLGLNGDFVMVPRGFTDEMVGPDTAPIVARLSGTLLEPVGETDLDTMVAALQVRANELEVERLEVLRLEEAERQRAAAEERNRLIEEQLRQRAEELAEREAEAAQEAAEEAENAAQQPPAPPPPAEEDEPVVLQPGFNLNYTPPQVNQPLDGTNVNRPFFTPLN
jgi:hypothetical protein